MINFDPNVSSAMPKPDMVSNPCKDGPERSDFGDATKAVEKYVSKVDDLQESANISIKDLLAGKNEDLTSVVSAMAKADISFKVLVGVRNKLIEAYKQTMNMQI